MNVLGVFSRFRGKDGGQTSVSKSCNSILIYVNERFFSSVFLLSFIIILILR